MLLFVVASESACCDKVPDTEMCTLSSQLPTFQGEDVSEHIYGMGKNRRLQNPRSDSVQLQRKAAKASRSGGACSKRPRLAQMDDSMSLAGDEDKIDITDKLGPFPTRRISPGNTVFCHNVLIIRHKRLSISFKLCLLKIIIFS